MMKRICPLLLTIALLGGGWPACTKKRNAQASAEVIRSGDIPARFIGRAEKRDIEMTVEVNGDVTPDTQLDVRPEVGGKIKAIHVEPGQTVKQGNLLVEIDDRDLLTEKAGAITEIDGARLVMEKNQRNFERGKELFAQNLINRETFDNLSADYEISRNSLEKSQRRLDLVEDKLRKTKIVAPSDGTVLSVPVIEGQVVTAAASVNSGTSLMLIADLSRLLVETHVNQVDVSKLHLDQKVTLSTESFRDMELEAVINFIAPVASVKNNVKGFQIKALIERPDPRLRPGMTVNLSVPVASAQEVVSVPISAVFKGENNARVIYVRRGDAMEKREVKVGISNLEYAEIKSGVEPGEEILLIEPRFLQKKKA